MHKRQRLDAMGGHASTRAAAEVCATRSKYIYVYLSLSLKILYIYTYIYIHAPFLWFIIYKYILHYITHCCLMLPNVAGMSECPYWTPLGLLMHLTIAKDESCLTDEDCQPWVTAPRCFPCRWSCQERQLSPLFCEVLMMLWKHQRSGSQNCKGDPSIYMLDHYCSHSQLTITEQ